MAALAIQGAKEKLDIRKSYSLDNTVELRSCALELFANQAELVRLEHVEGTPSAFYAKITAWISTEEDVHNFVQKYQEQTNEVLRVDWNRR